MIAAADGQADLARAIEAASTARPGRPSRGATMPDHCLAHRDPHRDVDHDRVFVLEADPLDLLIAGEEDQADPPEPRPDPRVVALRCRAAALRASPRRDRPGVWRPPDDEDLADLPGGDDPGEARDRLKDRDFNPPWARCDQSGRAWTLDRLTVGDPEGQVRRLCPVCLARK